MKTLHIYHNSGLLNGVEKTTTTLITELKKHDNNPIAVVPAEGDVTSYLRDKNFSYYIVPYNCCQSLTSRARLRFFVESYKQSLVIGEIFERESPNIVHINTGHLLHAGLAAAQCQIPSIWHIHSPFDIDLQRYEPTIGVRGYCSLLDSYSSGIIGVSKDVTASLMEKLTTKRIRTLYNGIDVDALIHSASSSSLNIRKELKLPSAARLIIGIGRISAQKDFATFVKVAQIISKEVENTYFVIVGPFEEDSAVHQVNTAISESGIADRIFLLGPRKDVPAILAQSNCLLSTAIFEGQGLVALEAMALQTPVVAMSCAGLRECIDHENDGLLVELGDIIGAAAAVVRVIVQPDFANMLTTEGKKTINKRFSSIQYAEGFMEIAKSAINHGPPDKLSLAFLLGLLSELEAAEERLTKFENQTYKHLLGTLIRRSFSYFK